MDTLQKFQTLQQYKKCSHHYGKITRHFHGNLKRK